MGNSFINDYELEQKEKDDFFYKDMAERWTAFLKERGIITNDLPVECVHFMINDYFEHNDVNKYYKDYDPFLQTK